MGPQGSQGPEGPLGLLMSCSAGEILINTGTEWKCGTLAPLPNAIGTCVQENCSVSSCARGFGDCDASAENGCEVELMTSVANCGVCENVCSSGICNSGVCPGCPSGESYCFGTCTNLSIDPNNCGSRRHVCSLNNASSSCSNGQCLVSSCNPNYGDCNSPPCQSSFFSISILSMGP